MLSRKIWSLNEHRIIHTSHLYCAQINEIPNVLAIFHSLQRDWTKLLFPKLCYNFPINTLTFPLPLILSCASLLGGTLWRYSWNPFTVILNSAANKPCVRVSMTDYHVQFLCKLGGQEKVPSDVFLWKLQKLAAKWMQIYIFSPAILEIISSNVMAGFFASLSMKLQKSQG